MKCSWLGMGLNTAGQCPSTTGVPVLYSRHIQSLLQEQKSFDERSTIGSMMFSQCDIMTVIKEAIKQSVHSNHTWNVLVDIAPARIGEHGWQRRRCPTVPFILLGYVPDRVLVLTVLPAARAKGLPAPLSSSTLLSRHALCPSASPILQIGGGDLLLFDLDRTVISRPQGLQTSILLTLMAFGFLVFFAVVATAFVAASDGWVSRWVCRAGASG